MRARLLVSTALAGLAVVAISPATAQQQDNGVIVFGAEANRLNAYAPHEGFRKQTVIPSGDEGGRDINAQICFFPDGSHRFIAGEDTGQPNPPPGWGIFRLTGERVGQLSARQVGKLTPTYQPSNSNPENYGCGFLRDGRIVTSDIGDQFPGQPGNGQLIVWFPPYESFSVRYCKIDVGIATAGGIFVDEHDRVYVASNRPGNDGSPAGVYRYSGSFPTSNDANGGCGRKDGTGAPQSDAGRVRRDLFVTADTHVLTPSAVARSAAGTFYVSSVFNGVIAEYAADGRYLRSILEPPAGLPIGQLTPGITPFGIGVDSAGTLYYADLGIVVAQPAPGAGSVGRVRFEGGRPLPPETMDDGLLFPDGIGVLELGAPATATPASRVASAPTAATTSKMLPATGGAGALIAALALVGAGLAVRRRVVRRPSRRP